MGKGERSGLEEHQAVNRAMWDERAPAHTASPDDVYRAPEVLGDNAVALVHTGVWALLWLPDIRGWALLHNR